jgi:RNA polymerase sigma-70 factor (ECF subfamily)
MSPFVIPEMDEERADEDLLTLAATDQSAWGALLERHRRRLRNIVSFRLAPDLRGRLDASDVVQEMCLEATERLPEFLRHPAVPIFVWLRTLALQRVAIVHRRHLKTLARDVGRERSLFSHALTDETSAVFLAAMADPGESPSAIMEEEDQKKMLEECLCQLDTADQEILILRHFEELTNSEAAAALNLKPSAAANRYLRALERLRELVRSKALPGEQNGQ